METCRGHSQIVPVLLSMVVYSVTLGVFGEITSDEVSLRAVAIGSNVTLMCKTSLDKPVDWEFESPLFEGPRRICSRGRLFNGYAKRYALSNSVPGDYSLFIPNVADADSGVYTCTENSGFGPGKVSINVTAVKEHKLRPTAVDLVTTEGTIYTSEQQSLTTTTIASSHASKDHNIMLAVIVLAVMTLLSAIVVIVVIVLCKKRTFCNGVFSECETGCNGTADNIEKTSPIFKGENGDNLRVTTISEGYENGQKDDGLHRTVSNGAKKAQAMGEVKQLICGEVQAAAFSSPSLLSHANYAT